MDSIANIVKSIEEKVQEINGLTANLATEMKKIGVQTVEKKKRSSNPKPRTKKAKTEEKEIEKGEEEEEGEEI